MKASGFAQWCLLLANVSMAMPGIRRRQAQTTSSECTCPANGPSTTTVSQYTVVTYSTTVTTQSGTVFSTGDTTSTEVVTAFATDTFTTTTDTVTNTYPGDTQTITSTSTTTSTITTVVTQTTCVTASLRKVKRQDTSTTTSSAIDSPSILTTTISSRGATCVCRPIPKTTTLASTSSCNCPATTGTTISITEDYTSSSIVTVSSTVPTIVTVTPTEFSTTIVTSTVTSATLASFDTTQSASTLTSQVTETVYTTYTSTSTVNSCTSSSTTSSSTTSSSTTSSSTTSSSTTSSSSTSTTSSSAIPSASGSLTCNATAYLIATTSNVPRLYNINLRTSTFFALNNNVGAGKYTNVNGMGFNVLDNFLYGIGTISSSTYAVVRISSTGATTEILQFTSSTTSPGTAGDIDTNGQFWFTGSGGTVWRQVDLAPGSSTYGTIVASGTSTLSGYSVLDWVYLPGQGSYMWSLATSTDSSPNLVVLRWGQSAHTWSVYQEYDSISAPNSIIANWGSNNGTIWGTAATSGQTTRVILGGTPVNIGTAPSGLTSADGARCAIATDD